MPRCRAYGESVPRERGQPVIVENEPGANGVLAANHLKAHAADGYRLMAIGMSHIDTTPKVCRRKPCEPAEDFDGIVVFGMTRPGSWRIPASAARFRKCDFRLD